MACQEGHTEIVTTLLAANASVTMPQPAAAHLFVACGHHRGRHVAAANAEVDQATQRQHGAAQAPAGHTEIVAKLLAASANVDQTNNDGATPLVVACGAGHIEVITALLAANADVNHAESTRGVTSLQIASADGHAGVVRRLLAAHADASLVGAYKRTALEVAQMHEHEVIQILERAQARSRRFAAARAIGTRPARLEIGVLVEVQLHEPSWNVTG